MVYTISKACEKDFPELISLFKEFAVFENLEHLMVNSVEQMMKEKDLFNCFIARNKDGGIIGYTTYFYAYFTWSGKAIYMDDLFVKETYRGKGLGKELIMEVIKVAKETNCSKVRWQVSNWNEKAISFYKSLGAEINEVERNCDLTII